MKKRMVRKMKTNKLSKIILNKIKKWGSTIQIKIEVKDETANKGEDEYSLDNIYGESSKEDDYQVFNLDALIYFNPSQQILSELGWEEDDIKVLIKTPYKQMRNKGLIKKVGNTDKYNIQNGDLLVINGQEYRINKIKPTTHYQDHHIIVISGIVG